MWGIIPAAGMGSRIQPLAFSKELLPLGISSSSGEDRPRAVSEYLIERMVAGGVDKICFVISPGKSDILNYFGGRVSAADIFYAVQPKPAGLCDAIFRSLPLIPCDEYVCIGLPDTIWFPQNGLQRLPNDGLSLLLFPVKQPQFFDAVLTRDDDSVELVQVKEPKPASHWIWGALKMPGSVLRELHGIWLESHDEYLGTVINTYLQRGGRAVGVKAGESYVDVGTLNGYREAIRLLDGDPADSSRSGQTLN